MHVRAHGAEAKARFHAQLPADLVCGCRCCGCSGVGTGVGVRWLRRGMVPVVLGGESPLSREVAAAVELFGALLAGAGAATARYPVRPTAAAADVHSAVLRARAAGCRLADAMAQR
jgi:hypothetical protein